MAKMYAIQEFTAKSKLLKEIYHVAFAPNEMKFFNNPMAQKVVRKNSICKCAKLKGCVLHVNLYDLSTFVQWSFAKIRMKEKSTFFMFCKFHGINLSQQKNVCSFSLSSISSLYGHVWFEVL